MGSAVCEDVVTYDITTSKSMYLVGASSVVSAKVTECVGVANAAGCRQVVDKVLGVCLVAGPLMAV
jgi:hypothetical protein